MRKNAMHPVTLTLTFATLAEAQAALDCLVEDPRQTVIDFADRPDTGVSVAEAVAFNPFAAASTAVAAAAPTVPVVPPVTFPTPPSASVPPAPTTVPEASAPAVPAAPTSPVGIDVDVDGLPWDARIHAGGRARNADGRWRQKRGLNDAALKAKVEAELRQAMGAPVVPAIPSPPAASAETFGSLMARIGPRLMSGAITEAQSAAVLAELGLESYAQLAVRADLVAAAAQRYDALVPA